MPTERPDIIRPGWHQVDSGWAVESEMGDFLYGLVRHERPETVYESGTYRGYSALRMAEACEQNDQGVVYTVDLKADGYPDTEEFYHPYIMRLRGDATRPVEGVPERIDLFFQDASHDADGILAELEWVYPRLTDRAPVIVHDWYHYRDIRNAYDRIVKRFGVHPVILHGGRGLYMWTKEPTNFRECVP